MKQFLFRMEFEIFRIQQQRVEQHKLLESAFEKSQTDFTTYRTELGNKLCLFCLCRDYEYFQDVVTKSMKELANKATEIKTNLTEKGQSELATIISSIQNFEEELLIVRYWVSSNIYVENSYCFFSAAHQVARLQKNEDEEELRSSKRQIRNRISELLEDYKAEMD